MNEYLLNVQFRFRKEREHKLEHAAITSLLELVLGSKDDQAGGEWAIYAPKVVSIVEFEEENPQTPNELDLTCDVTPEDLRKFGQRLQLVIWANDQDTGARSIVEIHSKEPESLALLFNETREHWKALNSRVTIMVTEPVRQEPGICGSS